MDEMEKFAIRILLVTIRFRQKDKSDRPRRLKRGGGSLNKSALDSARSSTGKIILTLTIIGVEFEAVFVGRRHRETGSLGRDITSKVDARLDSAVDETYEPSSRRHQST